MIVMNDKDMNRKAIKAGSFYVVGQIAIRGLALIATPIYTRTLTTEQFGLHKIFESWLLILVPVITLGLYRSVEVAKYDYGKTYEQYVANILRLGVILSAAFSAICLVFFPWLKSWMGFTDVMMVYIIAYIPAEFAIMCFQRREKQLMRYKSSLFLSLSTVTLGTALSIVLILLGKTKGYQSGLLHLRIIGYYTPIILGGYAIVVFCWRQGNRATMLKDWKYGLRYSIPLIAELISIQIMNQMDKIMINQMVGAEEAGIYSLATTISYIVWILEEAVWGAWLPWMYEKIGRGEEKEIQRPWTEIMHAFGILSVLLVLLAPEGVYILGGKSYATAAYIVAPLVCSTLFRFYSYSFSALQNFKKKTTYVALGTVLAMGLNVALNYYGILHFGYISAAYATAISYVFLLIIQAVFERKVARHKIIPLHTTILLCVLYFLLCEAVMILYDKPFICRYLLVAVILLGAGVLARKMRKKSKI